MSQLEFDTIVYDAWRAQDGIFAAYVERHLSWYLTAAHVLDPDRTNWKHVWDRVAYAILSANTDAKLAAAALRSMRAERDDGTRCTGAPGITPERLDYVRALPVGHAAILWLLRAPDESWDAYRCRLRSQIQGLGLTKASYAVTLLYPLEADVCCLDVWMQRHLLRDHAREFTWMNDDAYRELEDRVRTTARVLDVSTAITQWIMWDFIRTGRPSPQDWFRA
jgi:hypothetical protein